MFFQPNITVFRNDKLHYNVFNYNGGSDDTDDDDKVVGDSGSGDGGNL